MRKFKRLNRKGFTLIELLAVIVILALLMVIAIPTVLSSMTKARENQLQNAADSTADWFSKQYELAAMGTFAGGADTAFDTYVNGLGTYETLKGTCNTTDGVTVCTPVNRPLTKEVLTAAGLSNADNNLNIGKTALAANAVVPEKDASNNPTNESYVYYNTTTNRFCVVLYAKDGGSFYVNSKTADKNVAKSAGC